MPAATDLPPTPSLIDAGPCELPFAALGRAKAEQAKKAEQAEKAKKKRASKKQKVAEEEGEATTDKKKKKKSTGGIIRVRRDGKKVGTKRAVFTGKADCTPGGLTRDNLTKNKYGRIVSKRRQEIGLTAYAKNKDRLATPYTKRAATASVEASA